MTLMEDRVYFVQTGPYYVRNGLEVVRTGDMRRFVAARTKKEASELALYPRKGGEAYAEFLRALGTSVQAVIEAKVDGYAISLEKIVCGTKEASNVSKEGLWFAEILLRQIYSQLSGHKGNTRDFDYAVFLVASSEPEAIKAIRKRFFWTPKEFSDAYYEDNCPPPEYFDLECSIPFLSRVEVPGYKIRLEKAQVHQMIRN